MLSSPKSFTRRDFEPLLLQCNDLLTSLRTFTPNSPDVKTPSVSRRSGVHTPAQTPVYEERQTYWNEFDDGSDMENELYTTCVDLDVESQIFGARTLTQIFEKATGPMEKVRRWLTPMGSPRELQPLLQTTGFFTAQVETDVDDTSSSE